jgi:hypothetical protein
MPGEPRQPAIKGIEHHGHENEVSRGSELVRGEKNRDRIIPRPRWKSGDIHRAESADGIAQRGHTGQKINRPDIRPPTMPTQAKPSALADRQAIQLLLPMILR